MILFLDEASDLDSVTAKAFFEVILNIEKKYDINLQLV